MSSNVNPSAPPSYGEAVDDKYNANYGAGPQPVPYPQYGAAAGSAPYPAAQPGWATNPPQPQPQPYIFPPSDTRNVPVSYNAGNDSAAMFSQPAPHPADPTGGEAGFSIGRSFSDKNVRRQFIRRVFIILGIQLLVTFGIVTAFTLVPSINVWLRANSWLYWISYAVFLILYLVLVCVESVRRKHPQNLIMLGLFTLALSYMTGTIASYYSTKIVMSALGVTALVCFTVVIFSMQTKFDFTKCSGLLFVLLMVLVIFGFITIFTHGQSYYLDIVYGCLGALVFTLFLAFDTQLVMGGKKHELDPEEYVYGALTLYIDVVYIFLFILAIFGGSSD